MLIVKSIEFGTHKKVKSLGGQYQVMLQEDKSNQEYKNLDKIIFENLEEYNTMNSLTHLSRYCKGSVRKIRCIDRGLHF